jgi:hypothetical protein
VIPCGREDGKNTAEEQPYELKIRKKGNHFTIPILELVFLILNNNSQ